MSASKTRLNGASFVNAPFWLTPLLMQRGPGSTSCRSGCWRLAIGPYTLAEILRVLEPIGIDRWSIDLHHKYGIRDLMGVPLGGRRVFAFWSRKTIRVAPEERALLFLGAAYATIRLQKLVQATPARIPKGAALTARELSVLRALSLGERPGQVAKNLGLGEETVRTHIKKAQLKLGVETPGAAIASAIRLHLIP
jgi:LuxR family quorum sensing-dependent transcriptional regulator